MNVRARVIVCDDEEPMREMLDELLTDDGYEVHLARDGTDLRRMVPKLRPDLVIVDLRMPGEDGLSLTRWMREESRCGILMLTGMGSLTDRVVGLEMGADDYLPKPFEPSELRSRLKAILRRTMSPDLTNGRPPARTRVGRCIVDLELKEMFDENGDRVALTTMEFDLLRTFVNNARRVLTRDQLLEMAHHQRWDPFDRSIDIRISRLRKKVEFDPSTPSVIKTIRGEGYMLVPE